MFEAIINRLLETKAPSTKKLKIPVAGPKAFESILKLKGPFNPKDAIELAVEEFSRYSREDSLAVSEFRQILIREFSGLDDSITIKKKTKALKEIWEIEGRNLAAKYKRTKWLSIRVTEDEYRRVLENAQNEGLDLSTYLRKMLGLEYKE